MSAGRGIRHSEMNASAHEGARFIQMRVPPDTDGLDPGYEQQAEGDAVRLTGAGSRGVTAGADGAELVVWATA